MGSLATKGLTGHCRTVPLAARELNSRVYEVNIKRLEIKSQFLFAKLGPIS